MVPPMKLLRLFTLASVLAAGSAAYADKPASPPAKAAEPADGKKPLSEGDAQKFYAFFEKLVSICSANKDDCAKMAAGINAHIDANQALLKQADEYKSQGRELPPSVKEKIVKLTKEQLQPAMQKCGTDKDVQAALMRLKPQASTK